RTACLVAVPGACLQPCEGPVPVGRAEDDRAGRSRSAVAAGREREQAQDGVVTGCAGDRDRMGSWDLAVVKCGRWCDHEVGRAVVADLACDDLLSMITVYRADIVLGAVAGVDPDLVDDRNGECRSVARDGRDDADVRRAVGRYGPGWVGGRRAAVG